MAENEAETPFGHAQLRDCEAVAWKRGEVALPAPNAPSPTAERVKAIRKSVAKTSREFSRRFGIPVRTLEGWEQGRRQPDPSVLLRVIERPKFDGHRRMAGGAVTPGSQCRYQAESSVATSLGRRGNATPS